MMELLTARQVAEMLKVNPGTLANWRSRGEGPLFIKLGRSSVRYRRSDLLEWMGLDRAA